MAANTAANSKARRSIGFLLSGYLFVQPTGVYRRVQVKPAEWFRTVMAAFKDALLRGKIQPFSTVG